MVASLDESFSIDLAVVCVVEICEIAHSGWGVLKHNEM